MKIPQLNRVPLALIWLCVYLIRSLVFNSVSLNDVLLMGILAGLSAFYKIGLENQQVKELHKQLEELKQNDINQEKIIKEIKDSYASLKVSSSLRNVR